MKITPPPPQNRRKRGGPAFVKDPWKERKAEEKASAELEADAHITCAPRDLFAAPAPEEDSSVQLTIPEALEKVGEMVAPVPFSAGSATPAEVDSTAASIPDANGMTYCPECYLPLHPDPKPERLYIFLHALRYTTSMGRFETEMPEWAAERWEWDRS